MLTKRSWIVLLGGLNLLLGALLLGHMVRLPAAHAQSARPGDFVTVTAKTTGRNFDVLYVLDVPQQKLYGLFPGNPQTRQLVSTRPRDLNEDFGG